MEHANIIEFEVYGRYAMFTDPLTRVGGEKCTYHIPTYEALKGIVSSIYWKPTITWIVDRVRIMNPIQTEVKGMRPLKYAEKGNDLSFYTYLKDCRYQVRAHFEWNYNRPELENDRNENKHWLMAKRSLEKGGRRDVFLGTRECQAYVEPCIFGEGEGFYDNISQLDYGYMYHGITYPDEAYSKETANAMSIRYFHPILRNGILDFPRPEDCSDTMAIRKESMKAFGLCTSVMDMEEEFLNEFV